MSGLLFVPIAFGEGTNARRKENEWSPAPHGLETPGRRKCQKKSTSSCVCVDYVAIAIVIAITILAVGAVEVAVASICPFRKFPIRDKCKHNGGIDMEGVTGQYIFFWIVLCFALQAHRSVHFCWDCCHTIDTKDLKKEWKVEGLPVKLIQLDSPGFTP